MRVFVARAIGALGRYLTPGLVAAPRAGTRRVIAQSVYRADERSGGLVKTEEDPVRIASSLRRGVPSPDVEAVMTAPIL